MFGLEKWMPCCGQAVFILFAIGGFVKFLSFLISVVRGVCGCRARKSGTLVKKDYEKDVVYLYQFPRSPVVPNLSPFCLKLETWLLVNNIKHEVCSTFLKRSQEGLLPFVEFNGEQIADSQLIIFRLQEYFNIDEGLDDVQRGTARAIDRMIEGSAFYAMYCSKDAQKTMQASISGIPLPAVVCKFIGIFLSAKIADRLNVNGMGRHSTEEIAKILRKDIEAIDAVLGNKKFIFGDKPTTCDCTLFGHLATTHYLPFKQPIDDILNVEFPRVKALLERIRETYYPDWKPMNKENETKKAESEKKEEKKEQ